MLLDPDANTDAASDALHRARGSFLQAAVVTHKPPVASVAASENEHAARYNVHVRLRAPRQEIVADLAGMVQLCPPFGRQRVRPDRGARGGAARESVASATACLLYLTMAVCRRRLGHLGGFRASESDGA